MYGHCAASIIIIALKPLKSVLYVHRGEADSEFVCSAGPPGQSERRFGES